MSNDIALRNQITSLEDLRRARSAKRAVHVPHSFTWARPRPAAFMIQLSGEILLRLFHTGMFLYVPQKKSKRKPKGE